MALTITPQISGQQANGTLSYCFINEPLKVHVTDSDSAVTQIFVDVTQINNFEATGLSSKVKYIVRDIVSLGGIAIDLMKVVKQLHDFDVYHFSDDSELANAGKDSVLSKYIYRFDFYTNISTTPTTILKLPILGGRTFQNFVPAVNYTTPIRELGAGDFDDAYLLNYTNPVFSLRQISSVTNSDYSLITQYDVAQGSESCEGRIVWKSKLGGWMYWGMNLKTSKISGSHSGNIDNGMFESTVFSGGGSAYIPVNYTSVKSSNSITLKCLSLTAEELIAVAEISGSPAVYYQSGPSEKLELMKLTSATAPIKTHINGGDFSVSLSGLFEYESRVK